MIRSGGRTAFLVISLVAMVAGCGGGGGGRKGAANTPTPVLTSTPAPTAQPAAAWAVGFTLAARVILRSQDAGVSWGTILTSDAPLSGVTFVDREVGWAVGGATILHTTDGGVSWTDQSGNVGEPHPSPLLLQRVRFLDRNRGVAVGSEFVGTSPLPLVLTTVDAGNTWRPATLPPPGRSSRTLSDACVVADGTIVAVGFGFSGNVVLVSHDFGGTWTEITAIIDPLPAQVGGVACVGSSIWIAGGGTTLIVHSPDAGQTWVDQTSGIPPPITNALGGVTFVDALFGWVLGVGPMILHTTNGGTTWSRQSTAADESGGAFHAIAFANSVTGVAVGGNAEDITNPRPLAFHTDDAGGVWRSATLPTSVINLADVTMVP